MDQEYRCPLCQSLLPREKWIKITGQWEENKKILEASRKQIEEAKKNLEIEKKKFAILEKRHMLDMKKAARIGEQAGIVKGKIIEKKEREKMTKMLEKQAKDLSDSHKTIEKLREQIKKGTTPQKEGFDYEKQVQGILSEAYPEDRIKSTGKMGDVLQTVVLNQKEIGSILYECKNTNKFINEFIKEIKRHQETAKADFGVIVTHALKKDKSSFSLEEEIIIIDPLGLLDISFLLRNILIDMHKLKLTKSQVDKKGQEILRYMQTGHFKQNMVDNIQKARSAYDLLVKEVKNHNKDWKDRIKIYSAIHQNTQSVRMAIGQIVSGKTVEELESEEFKTLVSGEIFTLTLEAGPVSSGVNEQIEE